MPEISRFFGIIIRMYYQEEHRIPHFQEYSPSPSCVSLRDAYKRVTALILVGF
jgi:hypothetical protein